MSRKGKTPVLTSIVEYLANKEARLYDFIFTITPTGSYYTHKRTGHKLTQQELDDWYPLPVSLMATANVDKTKHWMNGHKSY